MYIGGIIGVAQRKISVAQSIDGSSSEAEYLWLGEVLVSLAGRISVPRKKKLVWLWRRIGVARKKNDRDSEQV